MKLCFGDDTDGDELAEALSELNDDLVGQFQIEEHALKGVNPPLQDHPPTFGLLIERPQKV